VVAVTGRDRGHRSVAESLAELAHTEYRVTYEEQCAATSDHHHVSFSAMNTPLEDLVKGDRTIADACPVCDGPVIHMSNQEVLN
jgi:hypothetical protein